MGHFAFFTAKLPLLYLFPVDTHFQYLSGGGPIVVEGATWRSITTSAPVEDGRRGLGRGARSRRVSLKKRLMQTTRVWMEKRKFGVAFFTPTPCPEVLYRNSEREVISCGIKMQNVSDFNGDRGKTCLKGVGDALDLCLSYLSIL